MPYLPRLFGWLVMLVAGLCGGWWPALCDFAGLLGISPSRVCARRRSCCGRIIR